MPLDYGGLKTTRKHDWDNNKDTMKIVMWKWLQMRKNLPYLGQIWLLGLAVVRSPWDS